MAKRSDHEGTASRGYALAILAATGWAAGGVMAKWLFEVSTVGARPLHLAAARALAAFVMLLVFLGTTRRDRLRARPRDLPFLALFGVAGLAAMHFTYFAAIEATNVPTAILLEYLAPVMVLVASVAFMGERFTWALPAGVALSVAGCALVVGAIGGEGLVVSPAGLGWGLAAAVFFAGYTLMGKHAASRFSPWTLLVYGLGAATVFWVAALGLRGDLAPVLTLLTAPDSAWVVLAMALFATVVPFAAFLQALSHIGATRASITSTLEPVIAAGITFAIPALYEPLGPLQILGGTLVLAACVLVQVTERPAAALPPPA